MHGMDPYALVGNVVAFSGVTTKTVFDLLINPRIFRRDLEGGTALEAAKRKRDRGDKATVVAFVLLTASYAIFIVGVLR